MDPQTRTHRGEAVIGALAARQWGVVSRRQLFDAGLSATEIRNRVRGGHLLPLHPGVYAVGHARLRTEGYWLAAVLAVGPGAVLSHRDAAGLHGLRPTNHARTDVTTTADRQSSERIQVHRTRSLDAQDITTVRGIPTTTVARTLVDLAYTVPHDHLTKAIREAERHRTFDLRAVHAALARTRGRRGRGHRGLREAIAECAAFEHHHTRSPLEDAFLRVLRDNGLSQPATNAYVEGFEVDASWRTQRIAVELDGWTDHRTRRAFEADRARDAVLMAAGWRVIRVTYRQLKERPDAVISTLRRLGL
jgi:very-short-patch-repair endonuclease